MSDDKLRAYRCYPRPSLDSPHPQPHRRLWFLPRGDLHRCPDCGHPLQDVEIRWLDRKAAKVAVAALELTALRMDVDGDTRAQMLRETAHTLTDVYDLGET